jgi:hypothetical protein
MTHEQERLEAPKVRDAKKHNRHHHHVHTETLQDGTIVKRYKKKKTLADGSLITKSIAKSTPPASDVTSESSPTDRVITKIRTKTKQIYPDGISHITTTVEKKITANNTFKPTSPNAEVRREEHVSLPDGSELVSRKEVRVLPDGNVSTITTTVCTVISKQIGSKEVTDAQIGAEEVKREYRGDEEHNQSLDILESNDYQHSPIS